MPGSLASGPLAVLLHGAPESESPPGGHMPGSVPDPGPAPPRFWGHGRDSKFPDPIWPGIGIFQLDARRARGSGGFKFKVRGQDASTIMMHMTEHNSR